MSVKLSRGEFVELAQNAGATQPRAENVFFIFKDTDGNYRGECYKNGEYITVRDIGPETVLQLLLTHSGK